MEWLEKTVDYGIIGFLILLSIIAMAIAVERLLIFRRVCIDQFEDKKTLELQLSNKLHIIASIGSNAPYIGLLGTVLGIMMIFYHMGTQGFMDTEAIMVGLALALKATAVGLLVAIPSIVIYNLLLRKIKVILMKWEINRG